MPTYPPYRSFWQVPALYWCWWCDDAGTGSEIEHNGDKLILGTNGTTKTYCAAIQFEAGSAPGWASKGPIAASGFSIDMLIKSISAATTLPDGITLDVITSAWDSSSNLATMRALTTGATDGVASYQPGRKGLESCWGNTALSPGTYGLKLSIGGTSFRSLVIATDPLILLRYYYQYTFGTTTYGTATQRSTLDADTLKALKGLAGHRRFVITVQGLKTNRQPSEEDAAIRVITDSAGSITRRMAQEPWKPTFASAGGLPVPMGGDAPEIDKAHGAPIKTTVGVVLTDGTQVDLASQIQLIGDSVKGRGNGELELRSLFSGMLERRVTKWSPHGLYSWVDLQYDDEHIFWILCDMILNASLINWESLYYNDMVNLNKRFRNVWVTKTIADTEIHQTLLSDWWNLIAPCYGLHNAEMGDGCWMLFHPAVYRDSLKVWTVRESQCVNDSFRIRRKNRAGCYTSVKVTDERSSAPESTTVEQSNFIPVSSEWRENIFDVTGYTEIFYDAGVSTGNDFPMARKALAHQVAQYMCGERVEVSGILGARFVDLNCGDQIVVVPDPIKDSAGNIVETPDPFLAMVVSASLNPDTLTTSFSAVHFPDYLGLHSVFSQDGVLGIWRWGSYYMGSPERGTDDDFSSHTGLYPSVLNAHWQGRLISGHVGSYDGGSMLDSTSGYCDCFDMCLAAMWKLSYADTKVPSWWSDENVVPILLWRKSSGDETLVFGIRRPGYPVRPTVASMKFSMVYYTTMTSGGFTGKTTYDSPPALIGNDDETTPEEVYEAASVAVMWKDDTIRIYLERSLIMEDTDATNFDKSAWDQLYIRSSGGGPHGGSGSPDTVGFTQLSLGTFTHLGQDGWITNLQRLNGINGIDPFYGPDDIADLIEE